jgi:hypothetical protein
VEKAEVQEKDTVDSQKMVTEEGPPQGSQSSGDKMEESLKILSEETLQLSEFLWQEEKLTKELCVLLKLVLRQLGVSFNLPSNFLPHSGDLRRTTLNDEAHLILINDQNEVTSKALEDYPAHVIFNVVSFVIPELGKSLTAYRKRISMRLGFFDRVNQELRNLRNIFASSPKVAEGGKPIDDGVKKALLTQKQDSKEQ